MMTLIPALPPADVTAVYSLVALISDPAAAKARLDELRAAIEEANRFYLDAQAEKTAAAEMVATAKQLNADSATQQMQARAAAERMLVDARAAEERTHNELGVKERMLAAQTADLEKREADLKEAIAQLEGAKKSFAQVYADKTSALAAREQQVRAMEDEAKRIMDRASAIQAALASVSFVPSTPTP